MPEPSSQCVGEQFLAQRTVWVVNRYSHSRGVSTRHRQRWRGTALLLSFGVSLNRVPLALRRLILAGYGDTVLCLGFSLSHRLSLRHIFAAFRPTMVPCQSAWQGFADTPGL